MKRFQEINPRTNTHNRMLQSLPTFKDEAFEKKEEEVAAAEETKPAE